MTTPTRSKTLATWIAVIGGSLGLHRFYLRGLTDPWGWLHPLPTFAGLLGLQRIQQFGQDDRLAWVLVPLLGLSVSAAMLHAIVTGLTPDEKWNARENADAPPCGPAGWAVVIGVILALLLGATALMSTLTYGIQRFVEVQVEAAREISQ